MLMFLDYPQIYSNMIETIEEFQKVQDSQNYKHLGLFTADNKPLVRFNSNSKSPVERLEMIKTRLDSPMLDEPYYIIKGKYNTQIDTVTDDYKIKNPNGNITMSEHLELPQTNGNKVYSLKEGIQLNTDLLKEQFENTYLKEKIKTLEEKITLLEDEINNLEAENDKLSEENTPLENNIGNWLSEISKVAVPILDKYFDLQERKLNSKNDYVEPTQRVDATAFDNLDIYVREFIETVDDNTKAVLTQMYNTAYEQQNYDLFLENLKDQYPDIFEQLTIYINNN